MPFNEILKLAMLIVRGTHINFNYTEMFMEESSIYKFTNENITEYFHHLQNKTKILSVIGSGNQILNAILGGSRKIDCFDISYFPEYYLFLQIASVIALEKVDYFHYYLSDDRDILFSDFFYDIIRDKLKGNYKLLWDSLYQFDDGYDIYNSLLFRQDFYSKEIAIEYNPFLQEDNYDKLKRILTTEDIEIKPVVADIVKTRFTDKYNLVMLSNILSYYFKEKEFVEFVKDNFYLENNGEVISYLYGLDTEVEDKFNKYLYPDGFIENVGNNKILVLQNKKTNNKIIY